MFIEEMVVREPFNFILFRRPVGMRIVIFYQSIYLQFEKSFERLMLKAPCFSRVLFPLITVVSNISVPFSRMLMFGFKLPEEINIIT